MERNPVAKASSSKRKQKLVSKVVPIELTPLAEDDYIPETFVPVKQAKTEEKHLLQNNYVVREAIHRYDGTKQLEVDAIKKKLQERVFAFKFSAQLEACLISGYHVCSDAPENRMRSWITLTRPEKQEYVKIAKQINQKKYDKLLSQFANKRFAYESLKKKIFTMTDELHQKYRFCEEFYVFSKENQGLLREELCISWHSLSDEEKLQWMNYAKAYKNKEMMKNYKENLIGNKNVEDSELPTHFPDAYTEFQKLLLKLATGISEFQFYLEDKKITFIDFLLHTNHNLPDEIVDWFVQLVPRTNTGEYKSLVDFQVDLLKHMKSLKTIVHHFPKKVLNAFLEHYIDLRDEICEFGARIYSHALTFKPLTPENWMYEKPHVPKCDVGCYFYVKVLGEIDIKIVRVVQQFENEGFTGLMFAPIKNKSNYFRNTVMYVQQDCLGAFPYCAVVGKCMVLTVQDYKKCRPLDIPEKDVYVCTTYKKLIGKSLTTEIVPSLGKDHGEIYYFRFDGEEALIHNNYSIESDEINLELEDMNMKFKTEENSNWSSTNSQLDSSIEIVETKFNLQETYCDTTIPNAEIDYQSSMIKIEETVDSQKALESNKNPQAIVKQYRSDGEEEEELKPLLRIDCVEPELNASEVDVKEETESVMISSVTAIEQNCNQQTDDEEIVELPVQEDVISVHSDDPDPPEPDDFLMRADDSDGDGRDVLENIRFYDEDACKLLNPEEVVFVVDASDEVLVVNDIVTEEETDNVELIDLT